jgi:hypothetical protein
LMAWRSPMLKRRLSSIKQRWYISDTEVNHIAHSLAQKAATHYVLPTHWDSNIDGGLLERITNATVHRLVAWTRSPAAKFAPFRCQQSPTRGRSPDRWRWHS